MTWLQHPSGVRQPSKCSPLARTSSLGYQYRNLQSRRRCGRFSDTTAWPEQHARSRRAEQNCRPLQKPGPDFASVYFHFFSAQEIHNCCVNRFSTLSVCGMSTTSLSDVLFAKSRSLASSVLFTSALKRSQIAELPSMRLRRRSWVGRLESSGPAHCAGEGTSQGRRARRARKR